MNRTAFTLLELLAVIVLLSLAVIVAAPGLAGEAGAARLDGAMARALELDGRARLLARSGTTVTLATRDDGRALIVQDVESVVLATASLPADVRATLDSAEVQTTIGFDRAGRSADYAIVVRSGSVSRRTAICGLTGFTLPESAR